jgi:hypothetical protein
MLCRDVADIRRNDHALELYTQNRSNLRLAIIRNCTLLPAHHSSEFSRLFPRGNMQKPPDSKTEAAYRPFSSI